MLILYCVYSLFLVPSSGQNNCKCRIRGLLIKQMPVIAVLLCFHTWIIDFPHMNIFPSQFHTLHFPRPPFPPRPSMTSSWRMSLHQRARPTGPPPPRTATPRSVSTRVWTTNSSPSTAPSWQLLWSDLWPSSYLRGEDRKDMLHPGLNISPERSGLKQQSVLFCFQFLENVGIFDSSVLEACAKSIPQRLCSATFIFLWQMNLSGTKQLHFSFSPPPPPEKGDVALITTSYGQQNPIWYRISAVSYLMKSSAAFLDESALSLCGSQHGPSSLLFHI